MKKVIFNKFVDKKKILIISIFLIIIIIGLVYGQVIETQVIDLSEKARNFFIEATKGNIQGQLTDNKFGENLDIGTTEEDIQSQGGTLVFLESAELISIISSDTTNDITGGINANSVRIFGLDENFTKIDEVVNLSATATNTTKEYVRVYRLRVETVGNYTQTNTGIITGTAVINGSVQIEIPLGEGLSQTTHYTVPAGHEVIITAFRVTMDTGKNIDVFLKRRENADDIIAPMSPVEIIRNSRGLDTPVGRTSLGNLKFSEKTDIWATALVSTGSAKVEANYDFLEYAIGT